MAAEPGTAVRRLFEARDGAAAHRCVDRLADEAAGGSDEARVALARYMAAGGLDHVRDYSAARLAELVREGDADLAAAFRAGLGDDAIRYWCVAGYVKAAGRRAYPEVAAVAFDESRETELRAQAIKCLAAHAGQFFDRGLPEDPGEWAPGDLRVDEIEAWVARGCPAGTGYEAPERHPALDRPKTRFETAVAGLDRRLAALREASQDLANPSNWLTPADPADVAAVRRRWKTLPSRYLDFLSRFSPLNASVTVGRGKSAREVRLYGASELIAAQVGYATDARGRRLSGWPKASVVVATADGDPYVLHLSGGDGEDAPVLTAPHGEGKWEFVAAAGSFEEFLRILSRGGR